MKFYFWTGAAVLSISFIPYLYGALTSPVGHRFIWGVGFLPDTLGNLVFTRQAADGAWLFINPYTGEPHPNRFFHPLFLILGWVQRCTGLLPGLVFQIGRLACAAVLMHAVYAICRRLFPQPAERRAGFVLVLTSGGLGFLSCLGPWFHRAADVRGAEITTFFSLYQQVHFAAALALIVWMSLWFIRSCETGSLPAAATAGLLHVLLVAVHPYDAPIPYAVAGCYAALLAWLRPTRPPRPLWKPLAIFYACPLPLLAYYAYLSLFVPVYQDYAREGLVAPPWPPLDYLLGYGLLVPLALVGLKKIFSERDPAWLFPAAWVLAVPLLMLCPIPARRKLMEGYHLFLALIAVRGALVLWPELWVRWRAAAVAGLAFLSLSSVYVMARDMYTINVSRRPERGNVKLEAGTLFYPLNRPVDRLFAGSPWLAGIFLRRVDRYDLKEDLLTALAWMSVQLDRRTVILAAPETGLLIPMLSPHRVMAGHLFGTLRVAEKKLAIRMVMDRGLPDLARRSLLARYGIGAVFWDPALSRLGEWRPGSRGWLTPLASFGDIQVFAVAAAPAATPGQQAYLRSELNASALKLTGKDFLDRGQFGQAEAHLQQAVRLRPDDGTIRTWLSECRSRRAGSPTR